MKRQKHIDGLGFETVEDKVVDVEVENIQMGDSPDFVDAYISDAYWESDGFKLSDKELDELNEDGEFILDEVHKVLY